MIKRNALSLIVAMLATISIGLETKQAFCQFTASSFEEAGSQTVEIPAGGSRRLHFDFKVPELLVENPDIIKATPVSPEEVLISGLKPGLSTLTVSDSDRNLHVVNVHVTVDVRKLQRAIVTHYPDSTVSVHALQTGVVLKGEVARSTDINNIMLVARDYFPTNVVNQMSVGGGQTVAIKVKVYEVSRSKLRELGVDWSVFGSDIEAVSGFSDLITNFADGSATNLNYRLGIFGGNTNIEFIINALERRSIAKLLDEPVLTAENGRPAEFLSGGEIPIQIATGLTQSIEFRSFGTKLDMVPIIHGQGEMTLEVRAEVSEVDNTLSSTSGVPGFRVRRVNTGVRMRAGHTLALAGDYREEVETQHSGLPHWMDKPLLSTFLSRKEDLRNETELVFLITPRFVTDVPAGEIGTLPGRTSTTPSDVEFYRNGHLEVPGCQDNDCPLPQATGNYTSVPVGPQQAFPQQGIPQQAFPQQAFPQQGIPQQAFPQQGIPQQGVNYGIEAGSGTHGGLPGGSGSRSIAPQGGNVGGFNWPGQ